MKPQPGDPAPAFRLPVAGPGYEEGAEVALGDLAGQRVVLVFYPKDSTPGCTQQACALRDRWEDIREKALVFGVSADSVQSHRKFLAKHSLPYPLLSDETKEMLHAYGVWVEKSLYGLKFMGIERSTFVIGPDGRIETVLEKVKASKHFEQLLAALQGGAEASRK